MTEILVLKTGALGDVLRTTSVLPGLHRRHPGARVTWLTAHGAADLVARHELVARVVTVDPASEESFAAAADELAGTPWQRVVSLDDELPLCRAATRLGRPDGRPGVVCGAYLDAQGERRYTPDAGVWFDMGLLSVHGKAEADRLKARNARSHPDLLAEALGVEPGHPELPLPDEALDRGRALTADAGGPLLGLNTGAGGRWESKKLPVERVVEVVRRVAEERPDVRLVLLGGPDEAARNAELLAGFRALVPPPPVVDAGTENSLLDFAGIVDRLDLLLTSDSLALHVAVARRVPVVAFFAPTSAAEIELYGRGEKVVSTAPDYCSYRRDADTSTLTAELVAAACLRQLPGGERAGEAGE